MLLYVDKKKERQKKVRRYLFVFFCLFFLLINVFQYQQSLRHTTQSLVSYESIRHSVPWFSSADVVYLFSSAANKDRATIVIPNQLNRENAQTLALALSKLSSRKYKVFVSSLLGDKSFIRKMVLLFYSKAVFVDTIDLADLLISSDFEEINSYILTQSLYPKVLNFKHAHKIMNNDLLAQFINKHFEQPLEPQNELEQEAFSLQQFIDDYSKDLQQFIVNHKEPKFAAQGFFLQNIRFCLSDESSKFVCSLATDVSLKENIKNAERRLPPKARVQKGYLLTSNKIINPVKENELAQDEGVYFYYQGIEAILLPDDIKKLDNIADVFYLLKERAGLNPVFEAVDMKFYKFKIREVTIDEKI